MPVAHSKESCNYWLIIAKLQLFATVLFFNDQQMMIIFGNFIQQKVFAKTTEIRIQ